MTMRAMLLSVVLLVGCQDREESMHPLEKAERAKQQASVTAGRQAEESTSDSLRASLIANPPINGPIDGWMDKHDGPWTEDCYLVEIHHGYIVHRSLADCTPHTFCDVPEHYGEIVVRRK